MTDARARSWAGIGLAERQRIRRDKLLRAGVELLGAADGPAVNVRAVCRATGITERYFYESFADRDQFVVEVYGYVGEQARRALLGAVAAAERHPGLAEAAVTVFVELIVDNAAMGRVLLLAPMLDPALRGRGEQLFPEFVALVHGQLTRITEPDLKQLIATGLVGALSSLFAGYLNKTITVDRDRFVRHCVQLFDQANRTPH
jgi:AcrR family transcriptional regulator